MRFSVFFIGHKITRSCQESNPNPLFEFWRKERSKINSCSGISNLSLSLISQFQESGFWTFRGEEYVENCFDNLPVLFWSEGLEIHGDSFDPFDSSSGWTTGV